MSSVIHQENINGRSWPKSDIARHRGDVVHGVRAILGSHGRQSIGTSLACQSADFSFTSLRRSALAITLTEERDIAAAAMIGDSSMPVKG